jgi:hypothetical protein
MNELPSIHHRLRYNTQPIPRGREYQTAIKDLAMWLDNMRENSDISKTFDMMGGLKISDLADPANVRDFMLVCSMCPDMKDFVRSSEKLLKDIFDFLHELVLRTDTIGNHLGLSYVIRCRYHFILACCWTCVCLLVKMHQFGESASTEMNFEDMNRVAGALEMLVIVAGNTLPLKYDATQVFVQMDNVEYHPPYVPSYMNQLAYCLTGNAALLEKPKEQKVIIDDVGHVARRTHTGPFFRMRSRGEIDMDS